MKVKHTDLRETHRSSSPSPESSWTHAEDEEELDEHGPKREDPSHQDSGAEKQVFTTRRRRGRRASTEEHSPHKLVHVPALLWDLPRDLVGAHWVVIGLFAEAEVVAQVDQGQGDTEPHAEQGQHGGEGNLGLEPAQQGKVSTEQTRLQPKPGGDERSWGGVRGSSGQDQDTSRGLEQTPGLPMVLRCSSSLQLPSSVTLGTSTIPPQQIFSLWVRLDSPLQTSARPR